MDNPYIYRLLEGTVSKCPLSSWSMPPALEHHVVLEPGEVRRDVLASLPAAAAIVHRVAPWTRCYAAPLVSARCYGEEDLVSCQGVLFRVGDENIIFLGLNDEETLLRMAHHESWHAIERFMAPHCTGILNGSAAQGFSYSSAYLRRPQERLARAFASWCMARLECPPDTSWRPQTSVELMFSQVESGEMADMVMGARRAA